MVKTHRRLQIRPGYVASGDQFSREDEDPGGHSWGLRLCWGNDPDESTIIHLVEVNDEGEEGKKASPVNHSKTSSRQHSASEPGITGTCMATLAAPLHWRLAALWSDTS